MFTDRFIKVPIEVYSVSDAEIMGMKDYKPSWEKFNPLDISSWFPSIDKESGEGITQVFLKNGHSFICTLPTDKFEKLLNENQK